MSIKKPGKNTLQYLKLLWGQKHTQEEKHKYKHHSS